MSSADIQRAADRLLAEVGHEASKFDGDYTKASVAACRWIAGQLDLLIEAAVKLDRGAGIVPPGEVTRAGRRAAQ